VSVFALLDLAYQCGAEVYFDELRVPYAGRLVRRWAVSRGYRLEVTHYFGRQVFDVLRVCPDGYSSLAIVSLAPAERPWRPADMEDECI
jgi:hypothetical protein